MARVFTGSNARWDSSLDAGGTPRRIQFSADGAAARAYLFVPEGPGPHPAVLVLHGHGSSAEEAAGLAPARFMGPIGPRLAKAGFIVLVPRDRFVHDDLKSETREALRLLEEDNDLKDALGARFVKAYTAVKQEEFEAFNKVISSWEREYLLLNV